MAPEHVVEVLVDDDCLGLGTCLTLCECIELLPRLTSECHFLWRVRIAPCRCCKPRQQLEQLSLGKYERLQQQLERLREQLFEQQRLIEQL